MKNNRLIKIIGILLIVCLLFSVITSSAMAAEKKKVHGNTGQKRPYTQNVIECNTKLDAIMSKLDKMDQKLLKKGTKGLKDSKEFASAAGLVSRTIVDIVKDPENVNWKNVGLDTALTVANCIASIWGLGGVSNAVLGPIFGAFKDKEPTEIELLQQHLDEQFEEIKGQLDDIRGDISDLSEEMSESFDNAIEILSNNIDSSFAGERVYNFTQSGEGNFDYNLIKNYLFGLDDSSNNLSESAYSDKLTKAIVNDAPDYIIEEYYNALYKSLTTIVGERGSYLEMLRSYVLEDDFGYSIQRYYYDWLSNNAKKLELEGKNAEWEAILFTLDLYKTLLSAEQGLALCENYFLTKIYMEYGANPSIYASYKYASPDGTVTYVKYGDLLNNLENLTSEARAEEVEVQIAKDVTYILNMEGSYFLQSKGGSLDCVVSDDSTTYVDSYQTVFLNKLTDEICEMFALDPQAFLYDWSEGEDSNAWYVDEEYNEGEEFSVTLSYKGTNIYKREFIVNKSDFCGGKGTQDDPYLVSSMYQFVQITTGEESNGVYYKLVNDIDFNGAKISPLGGNSSFEGTLDGNGYKVKNVKVIVQEYTGIFAKIGINGTIKNLTIEDAEIGGSHNIEELKAGVITAQNEGVIHNCHVKNSVLSVEINTEDHEKSNISTLVGGIAGTNIGDGVESGIISSCTVVSAQIVGKSSRTYSDGYNKNNKNTVKAAGITATLSDGAIIKNCIVEGNTHIFARSWSKDEAWDKDAFVTARASGMVALTGKSDFSDVVNVFVSDLVIVNAESVDDAGSGDNVQRLVARSVLNENGESSYAMAKREDVFIPTSSVKFADFNLIDQSVLQNYSYNADFINFDYIELFANGNKITDFDVLGYWGFDSTSSTKTEDKECDVTVAISTILDGESKILSFELPVVIEKIKPIELVEKEDILKNYYKGDSIFVREKFDLVYEDGSMETVTPTIISGSTENYGRQEIKVGFGGVETTFKVLVRCLHTDDESYYKEKVVLPTCSDEGYTLMECELCSDGYVIDGTIVEKIAHTIEIRNAVEATCDGQKGYTGDKYCTVCEEYVERGQVIDVLQHEYETIDTVRCKCVKCGKTEDLHEYSSVENESAIIYTCVKCGFSPDPVEKVVSYDKIPRIVVGNSYGVVGSDNEIIVYVKIFNNPGFTSVSFRIDYDRRLEYVRFETGDMLASVTCSYLVQQDGVIAFTSAKAEVNEEKRGNLLKLVFKLPEDAVVAEKYDVSIATNMALTDEDAYEYNIITLDGGVTAVDHLPGDVNSDGFVDMIDTAILVRAITNKMAFDETKYNFNEFYADVNLNGKVGTEDLVIMLQYLKGINTQEFTSNQFEVVLNTNNGSKELDSIVVNRFDEGGDGNYPELPIPVYDGYIFEGWYTSFDFDKRIEEGDIVEYNPMYLKQTLYAHWIRIEDVQYEVEFNANAPYENCVVDGAMANVTYTLDQYYFLRDNLYTVDGYEFQGWALEPNGEVAYADGEWVVNLSGEAKTTVTLYAVWKVKPYEIAKFVENGVEVRDTNDSGDIYLVYNDITKTPHINTDCVVIIDWSTCEAGEIDYSAVIIGEDGERYGGGDDTALSIQNATRLYFLGNAETIYKNLFIRMDNYAENSNIDAYFDNFNLRGSISSSNDPESISVSFSFKGLNSIESYLGESRIYGFIDFTIEGEENLKLYGGSGQENDPYLITRADQFDAIKVGKAGQNLYYYKLVNSIDFEGVERNTYGDYNNIFEGVLDGDGYAIKNLNVRSTTTYAGLFAKIGQNGVVKNIVFNNVHVRSTISGVTTWAGIITASSSGVINNCRIKNSSIKVDYYTESYKGAWINMYVGGFVGYTDGYLCNSTIENTSIEGRCTRHYGDGDDEDNGNRVYVAGIATKTGVPAVVKNCSIDGNSKVTSYALSWVYSFWTRYPRVGAQTTAKILWTREHPEHKPHIDWDSVVAEEGIELYSTADRENTHKNGGSKTDYVSSTTDGRGLEVSWDFAWEQKIDASEILSEVFPDRGE